MNASMTRVLAPSSFLSSKDCRARYVDCRRGRAKCETPSNRQGDLHPISISEFDEPALRRIFCLIYLPAFTFHPEVQPICHYKSAVVAHQSPTPSHSPATTHPQPAPDPQRSTSCFRGASPLLLRTSRCRLHRRTTAASATA